VSAAWAAEPEAKKAKEGVAEPEPVANAQRADRSRFVHRIELKDETGNVIGPKSVVPYSPKQTCGTANCHNYGAISRGSHTIMFADPRPDPERPPIHIWTVYDQQTRTQHPLSHGWLPKTPEDFKPKEHKTPFDLARELGAYHPGGGRYEYDRTGNRYDRTLAANLALREDESRPDYYDARWDQSGVLEIDCLVCHSMAPYDHVERGTQISLLNFKYAPTVGAGFGTVEGRVIMLPKSQPQAEGAEEAEGESDAEPPVKVHYRPEIFNPHGKVELDIGRPADRNCLFCHRKPAESETPWNDCWDADVHTKSGLACVDCHRATPWHAIYGSRRHGDLFRTDPDFATLSCEGCHDAGRLGSPVPEHPGMPKFHLDVIACEACHSGPHVRRVPLTIEKPVNYLWGTPGAPIEGSGPTVWTPVFKQKGGQIVPQMRMLPRFFAWQRPDGIEPVSPSRVNSRLRRFGRFVEKYQELQTDLETAEDDEQKQKLIEREARSRERYGVTEEEVQALAADKAPDVLNTETEITVLLKLLTRKHEDPERAYIPLYFAQGMVYSLDNSAEEPTAWTLQKEEHALAEPIDLPVAHSVRPAAQSLGAKSCLECHAYSSSWWNSMGVTQGIGPKGEPEGDPLHERIALPWILRVLGDLGSRFVQPYGVWVVLLIALSLAVHCVAVGPRADGSERVRAYAGRFGWGSRLAHFTVAVSFLVLAVSGLLMLAGVDLVRDVDTSLVHTVFGGVLLAGALLACVGYVIRPPEGGLRPWSKLLLVLAGIAAACLAVTGAMLFFKSPLRWLPFAYMVHKTCGLVSIVAVLGLLWAVRLGIPLAPAESQHNRVGDTNA
jgi:hypothetical protein